MFRFLPWLCLLALASAHAEVYKWVDASGVVHYSDEPGPGARAIQLPEISVYPFRVPKVSSPPARAEPAAGETAVAAEVPGHPGYGLFAIRAPAQNQAFDDSQGWVGVRIDLQPGLAPSHVIHLLLDGRPVRTDLRSTETVLTDIAGGSHVLEARLLDAGGQELSRAKSVLFHLR